MQEIGRAGMDGNPSEALLYFNMSDIASNTNVKSVGWLVGFGFNGPLSQYFSLYRAVSQREGDRGKKG